MFSLILSVLALFIGVTIYPMIRRKPSWLSFFDAFGLISIVGLTMLHLIPHSVENGGILGLIAVGVGLGVPGLLHLLQHHDHHGEHSDEENSGSETHSGEKSRRILMACVLIGFAVHTLLDGIGLSMSSLEHAEMGQMLGLGVLFHRLPVGIFLSLILVPRVGIKKTWGLLGGLAASTILGFALGHFALPAAGVTFLYVLQGLIAGMLLHVVFHNISAEAHGKTGILRGLGGMFGFGALAVVEWIAPVHAHEVSILDIWVRYLLDAAPVWVILAVILAVAWKLSAKGGLLGKLGGKVVSVLDPQPLPMLYGGQMHAFSAALIVLAWTLFEPLTAAVILISILAVCQLSRLVMKRVTCCASCSPGHYCAREQSYALWSMACCTQIAVWLLVAAVLPSVCAPLVEGFSNLSACWQVCLGALAVLLVPAVMLPARPFERMPNYVLILMMLCLVMHEGALLAGMSAAAAGLLVVLYEYSLRAIQISESGHGKWQFVYVCMILIGAVLPACAVLGAGHLAACEEGHGYRMMRYEIEVAHHDHVHAAAHAHEGDAHTAHDGHAHAHEGHAHAHEGHAHAGHEVDAHAHEGHAHAHDVEADTAHVSILHAPMHAWFKVISLALFLIVCAYWMFRRGPRYMLEVARGHHHHQHD